ncbi:Fic family protein [Candidatus Peregrinibacteria bacterium]|nr:Fic family protein [Candidatus Peregrinibacteria bacterium]
MHLSTNIINRLAEKRKRLNSLRPLPAVAVRKLKEHFEVEMTYNSNGIEGNSLTLRETFLVLNEGVTIKGKPLKDHLEATNHKEALDFLYDLVGHGKKITFSEHLIKSLHQLVTQNIEKDWAGRYRNASVRMTGTPYQPPSALNVPALMNDLIRWVGNQQKKLHVVELAAMLQHKLVYIHPFFDGNGRTARLIMNVLLLQKGYPLAIILKNDRKRYYRVLQSADNNNYKPLVEFVAKAVERSLDIYLDALTPSSKTKEKYITLSKAAKNSHYSAKYLNLLANKGSLEAHKEGRNWVTTEKAIQRYKENRQRKRPEREDEKNHEGSSPRIRHEI